MINICLSVCLSGVGKQNNATQRNATEQWRAITPSLPTPVTDCEYSYSIPINYTGISYSIQHLSCQDGCVTKDHLQQNRSILWVSLLYTYSSFRSSSSSGHVFLINGLACIEYVARSYHSVWYDWYLTVQHRILYYTIRYPCRYIVNTLSGNTAATLRGIISTVWR